MFAKNVRLIALIVVLLAASVAVTRAAVHSSITIASLNISTGITEFPLADGTWAIDPWETGIGHLQETAWFDGGNMVLAGHSVMPDGSAGVFYSLNELTIGQEISIVDGDINRLYQVSEIYTVPVEDVSVVMPTNDERLTLITCEVGSFDKASGTYTNRLVVIAQRVG